MVISSFSLSLLEIHFLIVTSERNKFLERLFYGMMNILAYRYDEHEAMRIRIGYKYANVETTKFIRVENENEKHRNFRALADREIPIAERPTFPSSFHCLLPPYTHTSLRSTFSLFALYQIKIFAMKWMRLEMSIAIRRMSKVESALWNWNDVCGHGNSTATDIRSKFVFGVFDVVRVSTSQWRFSVDENWIQSLTLKVLLVW
jgi:hypothetical protein